MLPMRQTLLIIDGTYFLFRAYAVPFKFYSAAKKIPLHVLTTYLKLLRSVIEVVAAQRGLEKIVVIFDGQQGGWRPTLDANYKSNRRQDYSLADDSPFHHYPLLRRLLSYLEIANYESGVGEADDLIASLAERYKNEFEIYIASNDSDFYQLVADRVKIVRLKTKSNLRIVSVESVVDELGIAPEQYVSWKSLVGDRADNIAGIRGIGPKKATAFLGGSLRLDLAAHQARLRLNQRLIRLDRQLPLGWIKHPLTYSPKIMDSNRVLFAAVGYI